MLMICVKCVGEKEESLHVHENGERDLWWNSVENVFLNALMWMGKAV